MTQGQQERTQKMMTEYAGETVTVENVKGTLYTFGSELACLRIYAKYRGKGRVGFSQNMQTWYFSLDLTPTYPAFNSKGERVMVTIPE